MFTLDFGSFSLSGHWPATALAFAAGLGFGILITALIALRQHRLRAQAHGLAEAEWAQQKRWYEERDQLRQDVQQQLSDRFSALSAEALQRNNDVFLRLAEQRFERLRQSSGEELRHRQSAIESMLQPIREALGRSEAQIREIEKERREAYGALGQHLHSLAAAQSQLQDETRNLVSALRRPEVRGQWGELTLKRLVELAGMAEHCDFTQQFSVAGEAGLLRPDMVVNLPGQRQVVIDAKTPLDAYLSAVQAESDRDRDQHLDRHAAQVSERIRELAAKKYWTQFSQSPDFVVLFIPGEQFLSAALDRRPQLLDSALQSKVVLATPGSLIALLKTVAFGWRQQAIAENAERIQKVGEQLHRRIGVFSEHLTQLGKSLGSSLDHYNAAVGSLDRQLLPAVRRLEEMGIRSSKQLGEHEPVTRGVRQPISTRGAEPTDAPEPD